MATTQTLKQFANALTNNKKHLSENEKALADIRKQLSLFHNGLRNTIGGINKYTFAITGLTLGIGSLIKEAFNLGLQIIRWRNEFNYLSDATGDTTKAISLMTSTWNKSLGSLTEIQSTMGALAAQGMSVGKSMNQLTLFVTDMARASGLSTDSLARLTGGMVSYWKVSVSGAKQMTSAVLAAGAAFNSTRDQMQDMITTITDTIDKVGALFKDAEKSAIALSKGIAMSQGALIKMGVSAKTSQDFISKILDPSRFEETNALMRMLGITFEEQMKMYESASGKELFFDKLLQNLPILSRQIQSIANPLARLRFAESIGLPPEIATKLANASQSQMREIIQQYKEKAEMDKAAEEKRKKAAAAEAKFSEQLMFLKMQILAPLMNWATGPGWALLQRLRDALVPFMSALVKYLTQFLEKLPTILDDPLKALKSGKLGQALGLFLGNVFAIAIPHMFRILRQMIVDTFKNSDWFGKGLITTISIIIIRKIFYGFQSIGILIEAITGKQLTWAKIPFTQAIGKMLSLFFKGFTNIFSNLFPKVSFALSEVLSQISSFLMKLFPRIFSFLTRLFPAIIKNISITIRGIPIIGWIIGAIIGAFDGLRKMRGEGEALQKTIGILLNIVTFGLLSTKTLRDLTRGISNVIERIIYNFINFFKNIREQIINFFNNFSFSDLVNSVINFGNQLWNSIKQSWNNIFNAINKRIDDFKKMFENLNLSDILESILNGFGSFFISIWNWFKGLFEDTPEQKMIEKKLKEKYGTTNLYSLKKAQFNEAQAYRTQLQQLFTIIQEASDIEDHKEFVEYIKNEKRRKELQQTIKSLKEQQATTPMVKVVEQRLNQALKELSKTEKKPEKKDTTSDKVINQLKTQTGLLINIESNTDKIAKQNEVNKPRSATDFIMALLGGGPTLGLAKGVII